MSDVVQDLRNLSAKFNQLIGAARVVLSPYKAQLARDGVWDEIVGYGSDGKPDVLTRAADEIVALRARVKPTPPEREEVP